MPFQLVLPIALRVGAAIVFVIAVIVAGALNRPFIMVPLIAATATLTQFVAGKIAPSPIQQLGAALNAGARPPVSINRLWLNFILGSAGYAAVFILTVFISAIFQETELARTLNWTDFGLLIIPAGMALILSILNARTSAAQVADMMGNLQGAFGEARPGDGAEPFTVEGEIIDPDDPKS